MSGADMSILESIGWIDVCIYVVPLMFGFCIFWRHTEAVPSSLINLVVEKLSLADVRRLTWLVIVISICQLYGFLPVYIPEIKRWQSVWLFQVPSYLAQLLELASFFRKGADVTSNNGRDDKKGGKETMAIDLMHKIFVLRADKAFLQRELRVEKEIAADQFLILGDFLTSCGYSWEDFEDWKANNDVVPGQPDGNLDGPSENRSSEEALQEATASSPPEQLASASSNNPASSVNADLDQYPDEQPWPAGDILAQTLSTPEEDNAARQRYILRSEWRPLDRRPWNIPGNWGWKRRQLVDGTWKPARWVAHCKRYASMDGCSRGEDCEYFHDPAYVRPPTMIQANNRNRKRDLCRYGQNCRYGPRCTYRHLTMEELDAETAEAQAIEARRRLETLSDSYSWVTHSGLEGFRDLATLREMKANRSPFIRLWGRNYVHTPLPVRSARQIPVVRLPPPTPLVRLPPSAVLVSESASQPAAAARQPSLQDDSEDSIDDEVPSEHADLVVAETTVETAAEELAAEGST